MKIEWPTSSDNSKPFQPLFQSAWTRKLWPLWTRQDQFSDKLRWRASQYFSGHVTEEGQCNRKSLGDESEDNDGTQIQKLEDSTE